MARGQALESRSQLFADAIDKNYPFSSVEMKAAPSFSGAKGTATIRTSALGLLPWVDRTCTANVYKEDQQATTGVYKLNCD
jgi:hypothetical protein